MGRATLQNISISGCFITNNTTDLERDDQILIVIELTECDKPLELKAIVVRVGDKDLSVKFTDIEESFITDFSTMLAIECRNSLSN